MVWIAEKEKDLRGKNSIFLRVKKKIKKINQSKPSDSLEAWPTGACLSTPSTLMGIVSPIDATYNVPRQVKERAGNIKIHASRNHKPPL